MINLLFYDHKILNNTSSLVCFCFYERAHLIFDVLNRLTGGVFFIALNLCQVCVHRKEPFLKIIMSKKHCNKTSRTGAHSVFFPHFFTHASSKNWRDFLQAGIGIFFKVEGRILTYKSWQNKAWKKYAGENPYQKKTSKTVTSPRLKS